MRAAVAVEEGLAAIPPGPVLATVLVGIDVARVPNELLAVLRAQSRQAAHASPSPAPGAGSCSTV